MFNSELSQVITINLKLSIEAVLHFRYYLSGNSLLLIPYTYQYLYVLPGIQGFNTLLVPCGPHHLAHHYTDSERDELAPNLLSCQEMPLSTSPC